MFWCKLWLHCVHEYTSARAERGIAMGSLGETCQKWVKQMTEKGYYCSPRVPEEVNTIEEKNIILTKNNIDIRRNGNILATGRFSLETAEDFQALEAWGCGAAFQEEQASHGVWSGVENFNVKGREKGLCFRSTTPAPCLSFSRVAPDALNLITDSISGLHSALRYIGSNSHCCYHQDSTVSEEVSRDSAGEHHGI